MEFNYTNNNIFGSRAETYHQNGASREMLELVHKQDGHKGVKELIQSAPVTKAPQTPAAGKKVSIEDRFESSQPAEETMSFAKMAAFMAGSKGLA
ncbi:hypothetical protein ABS71_17690 [bacterium SCN 62-11]|nr:hypothetical protein [Candidatus Eremiobacteraeota bacterium]ODT59747.1 MAG: hypothetical protein ABS71_17690 [bacterium SCN 62-11]